jgi:hypothetical protein
MHVMLLPAALANEVEQSIPMNETGTTTATLERVDEEILTYEVSDETLEAAAGPKRGPTTFSAHTPFCV